MGGFVAWNVMLNGEVVERVFYDEEMGGEEVKEALINYEGHSPKIVVQVADE
jgi:hypothetical protein